MPLTYPLTLPTSGITSISWTNATSSLISKSPFSFQGQAQSYGGAIRHASITVENLNRNQSEDWLGWLDSLHGTIGTFLFGDPVAALPMGSGAISNNPRFAGGGQTGDVINLRGTANAATNWLVRGDWIQVGSGLQARLHKVTQNVTTTGTNTAVVNIWPALRYSPANDAPITIRNTVGLFRRSTGTYRYSETNDCRYGLSFDIEEVI